MISKLRRKLMLVLMSVMCLFLTVILASSLISAHRAIANRARRAMNGPHQKEEDRPQFHTPVAFATLSDTGDISIETNQIFYLTDEQLIQYIRDLAILPDDTGEIGDEQIQFLRRPGKDGMVYIFVDTQADRAFFSMQVRNTLVIAGISLIAFLIVSYLLSRWMIRPVATAWTKQRQFVADASHELKTPLTVILSNTDMLIASGVVTDPRNRQRLDNISAESQRMRSLVESLLTLARSDSMPQVLPLAPVNLSFQVSSTVLTLEPSVYDAGHSLITSITPDLYTRANTQELTQLVEILVDNACKYSDAGSDIHLYLTQTSRKEALLRVNSQGKPLSRQECANIFERFYRTDASRESTQGYGLGLSIASEIVRHCNGTIWATSEEASGNSFLVRFPLIQSPANLQS